MLYIRYFVDGILKLLRCVIVQLSLGFDQHGTGARSGSSINL